jgi:DNA-binding Xre family transcriptional regulator
MQRTLSTMIRWNLEPHMARKGWTTAYQLAKASGLSQPGAARVLLTDPVGRIDVPTLEALAKAFGVKPWRLLDYEP